MKHKTVLIVGAGMTRAAHRGGLRIPDIPPPLDKDFFQITSRLHSSDHEQFVRLLEDLYGRSARSFLESLEFAFSTIWEKSIEIPDWKGSQRNHYSDLAIKLVELIQRVLAQTSNQMDVSESSNIYRLVRGEIAFGRLTIITFNYDLLLEQVLDRIATTVRTQYRNYKETLFCFPGCYRLEKLIGTFPEQEQFWYEPDLLHRPRFENYSELHEGVELLKLHGSLSWMHRVLEKDDMRGRVQGRGFGGVYTVDCKDVLWNQPKWINKGNTITLAPAIVPPIPNKKQILAMPALKDIWELARKRIDEATRITIVGYSFPDADVEAQELLTKHLSNLNFLNVINPDDSICKKVEKLYCREVAEYCYSIEEYNYRFHYMP